MKRLASAAVLTTMAALQLLGQFTYTPEKSSFSNVVVLAENPTTLERIGNDGGLIETIAQVPGGQAMTKVFGNYLVTTGSTLVSVTPQGAVTTIANAPTINGVTAGWFSIAPDGLGNVVMTDNHQHAVWLVNLQTGTPKLIANYPVPDTAENEDAGIAVDPSGNYLVLEDNDSTLSMFAISPTGTVTAVTLTGASAKSTLPRLIRWNGGYAFLSYKEDVIYSIAFTTPPGTATPPVATIAEVVTTVVASGTPTGLATTPDNGDFHVATTGPGSVEQILLHGNANGACPQNCVVNSIIFPNLPRDVFEETWGELPYLALGNGWTTGIYVVNTGDTAASYTVNFYNPSGTPATLTISGIQTTALTGTLPPHGELYVEPTNPAGTLITVSGLISADATISVEGLFRFGSNNTYYEASVPSTIGGGGFSMPFDFTTFAPTGQQLTTGIAISNMFQTPATVICTATNQAGTVIPNAVIVPTIPALGQFAGYAFTPLYGQAGTLTCISNTRIAGVGVRSLGTTFSTLSVLY